MQYSKKLIEHFENPKNVGSFDDNEPNVGTGLIGSPACGDVMKFQIKVDPATDIILDARFKTFGCGSAIASGSLITEWVKGKTLDEAKLVNNRDVAAELELPPIKIHCSVMAKEAIDAAIDDYVKRKSGEKGPGDEPTRSAPGCGLGISLRDSAADEGGTCKA
jgi:nitrogen fixation protein NifU and related proteins